MSLSDFIVPSLARKNMIKGVLGVIISVAIITALVLVQSHTKQRKIEAIADYMTFIELSVMLDHLTKPMGVVSDIREQCDAALADPNHRAPEYATFEVSDPCIITATLRNIGGDVDGKTLTLTLSRPSKDQQWGGTINDKYLPR